jgi:hypothetical protein
MRRVLERRGSVNEFVTEAHRVSLFFSQGPEDAEIPLQAVRIPQACAVDRAQVQPDHCGPHTAERIHFFDPELAGFAASQVDLVAGQLVRQLDSRVRNDRAGAVAQPRKSWRWSAGRMRRLKRRPLRQLSVSAAGIFEWPWLTPTLWGGDRPLPEAQVGECPSGRILTATIRHAVWRPSRAIRFKSRVTHAVWRLIRCIPPHVRRGGRGASRAGHVGPLCPRGWKPTPPGIDHPTVASSGSSALSSAWLTLGWHLICLLLICERRAHSKRSCAARRD